MKEVTAPGKIIKEYLKKNHLTIKKAAKEIGISSKTLSQLIHENIRISAGIAAKLARFSSTTAESWLAHQQRYQVLDDAWGSPSTCSYPLAAIYRRGKKVWPPKK